jgi:hypothetical protein
MRLIVRAASLRSEALDALAARDAAQARDLAAHAQTLHATPAGRSLLRLSLFLAEGSLRHAS